MWRYTEALEAHVVTEAGVDPSEVARHSGRIRAATTLAAGGEVPQRVFQRKGVDGSPQSLPR